MAPEVLFKLANLFAVAGWICMIAGIVTNRPWLRDRLAGLYWPLTIAVGYALAIMAAGSGSEGGFASLTGVRQLFANDWALLAGWMHYLAFDLFRGRLDCGRDRARQPLAARADTGPTAHLLVWADGLSSLPRRPSHPSESRRPIRLKVGPAHSAGMRMRLWRRHERPCRTAQCAVQPAAFESA
jgi:Domain of unknown function (DUF4281)